MRDLKKVELEHIAPESRVGRSSKLQTFSRGLLTQNWTSLPVSVMMRAAMTRPKSAAPRAKPRLTIAIPGGERSKDFPLQCLREAGLEIPDLRGSRSLKHDLDGVTLLEVKDADVPVYVDVGVADCGIVGKDWILESGRDVYEPLDLGGHPYRLSLIRTKSATGRIERVASKYARIARRFIAARGIAADVLPLNGKLELAVGVGLVDAIIDVVQTGRTLQENGLEEIEVLERFSTRFIVNRAALKLKVPTIRDLIHRLERISPRV
jgi:ATP phosphoribosyltransferase